jgi:hypothetical protein
MPSLILPVAKLLYVCDDVIRDPSSGKVSVLNLWEAVRVSADDFPYALGKLCIFAQFRGGLGEVPFHVEIMTADFSELIRQQAKFSVSFRDRLTTYHVKCKLTDVSFPSPGTYIVALFCNNEFVDDQPIRVVAESIEEE